jgi:hypothetical protein
MLLDTREEILKSLDPVGYLKFLQQLSIGETDRHTVAPTPHIHTDPKL